MRVQLNRIRFQQLLPGLLAVLGVVLFKLTMCKSVSCDLVDEVPTFYPMIDAVGIPATKPTVATKLKVLKESVEVNLVSESNCKVTSTYLLTNPSDNTVNADIGCCLSNDTSGALSVRVDGVPVVLRSKRYYVPQHENSSYFGGPVNWQIVNLSIAPFEVRQIKVSQKLLPSLAASPEDPVLLNLWRKGRPMTDQQLSKCELEFDFAKQCSCYCWDRQNVQSTLHFKISAHMEKRTVYGPSWSMHRRTSLLEAIYGGACMDKRPLSYLLVHPVKARSTVRTDAI